MMAHDLQDPIGHIQESGTLIKLQREAATTVRTMHMRRQIRTTPQLVVALELLRIAGLTPHEMANGDRAVNGKMIKQIMARKASYTEDINVEIADRAIAALNTLGILFCGTRIAPTENMSLSA